LEVGITYSRMLCNDFTGPAQFRLNMPEVALDQKRVWHPWVNQLFAAVTLPFTPLLKP